MIISAVAKRYAKAIFEIGMEEGTYRELLEEIQDFCDTLDESREVKDAIESSVFNAREKRDVLDALLGRKSYREATNRFLRLVFEKKRIPFIRQILDGFKALVEELEGIERVAVTVPKPLSETERDGILQVLFEKMGKKIVLEEMVEPAIIGGMIIKAGSTVYDGSVKNQIHKLGENLKKGR